MDPVALTVGLTVWLSIGAAVSWWAWRLLATVPSEPAPSLRLLGAHVLGAALIMILVQGLAVGSARHLFEAAQPAPADGIVASPDDVPPVTLTRKFVTIMSAVAVANMITVALVVLGLRAAGVSNERLGLSLPHVGGDIRLGLLGFLAFAPPTLALQASLRWAFPEAIKQHEVERQFAGLLELEQTEYVLSLAVIFWAVGVMAPIAEELVFRVLLLGWAERAIERWTGEKGGARRIVPTQSVSATHPPAGDQPRVDSGSGEPNPYQTPGDAASTANASADVPAEAASSPASASAARLALVFTSLLFAGAHATQWPDPIALFVFSCGLGFLYQRTHRWLPSVVMHATLNTFSLTALAIALAAGELK